jgi:hypothetical protein
VTSSCAARTSQKAGWTSPLRVGPSCATRTSRMARWIHSCATRTRGFAPRIQEQSYAGRGRFNERMCAWMRHAADVLERQNHGGAGDAETRKYPRCGETHTDDARCTEDAAWVGRQHGGQWSRALSAWVIAVWDETTDGSLSRARGPYRIWGMRDSVWSGQRLAWAGQGVGRTGVLIIWWKWRLSRKDRRHDGRVWGEMAMRARGGGESGRHRKIRISQSPSVRIRSHRRPTLLSAIRPCTGPVATIARQI